MVDGRIRKSAPIKHSTVMTEAGDRRRLEPDQRDAGRALDAQEERGLLEAAPRNTSRPIYP
jgi:hypothetical protein